MSQSNNSEWKTKADINDRNWQYTPPAFTDVAKTIARVRKEMEELKQRSSNQVVQLKKVAK